MSETSEAQSDFPCGNCGAEMSWSPESDSLSCKFCGETLQVPRGEGTVVERALEDAGEAARGFGLELKVSMCSNCGARVTFEGSSTSENCVYCGSAGVLAQDSNRNAIRPESLVPLDLARSQVETQFREWIGKLWFRPNALKKVDPVGAVGVYVPFWTFDCAVHSDWSADAGHYYYVNETHTVHVNGKAQRRTRRVRKTRWVPAWGQRDDSYDDELVHASAGVPPELVLELGDFNLTQLVPYKAEYLAGWRAEEYQVDLEAGWDAGRNQVIASQEQRCSRDVPGDTQRNLRVQNFISEVRWKHILLPIWSLQYKFGGKTHTVLVHGQNGRVAGTAPVSWAKILLAVLFAAALIAAIVVATQ